MLRHAVILATVLTVLAGSAAAQPVNLTAQAAPGDRAKYTIDLELKGNLIVAQDDGKQPVRLEARARHVFAERVLAITDGFPGRSARYYDEAVATTTVAGEKSERSLPADRRLIVARRGADGLSCFAAAGPLTREELDLVTEHFNPQCLPGLLPGKAVNVGDTWAVGDDAARTACLFDALVNNNLTGKLTGVKDGLASFTLEGTAEGIEAGGEVKLVVSATGTFEVAAGRVTGLVWKQKDDRAQGPVSPAAKVEATVTLKRENLPELPRELSDAAVADLSGVDVPAKLTSLRHADPKGRYQIVYPRDWHVTGQTDVHLVLRLLDRGEFIAQATVGVWKKTEPGKHTPAAEFAKAVADTPGWTPTKVLAEGEVPAAAGRWAYRLVVEGKMENAPVVQTFYLVAGPQGDQVAVTVAARPDKVKAIGTRDFALVSAIEFGKK